MPDVRNEDQEATPTVSQVLVSWKILVCGEAGVGKTTFIETYKRNAFIRTQAPTLGVRIHSVSFFYQHPITKYKQKRFFQIWDVSGHQRFYDMQLYHRYALGTDLALCCFDVTDLTTLEALPAWLDFLPCQTLRVLLGLKMDLTEGSPSEALVTVLQAYQEAYAFASCIFLSSTHVQTVKRVFGDVRRLLRQQQLDEHRRYKGV